MPSAKENDLNGDDCCEDKEGFHPSGGVTMEVPAPVPPNVSEGHLGGGTSTNSTNNINSNSNSKNNSNTIKNTITKNTITKNTTINNNTNGASTATDTRFGGLAGAVEASVNSSVEKHLGGGPNGGNNINGTGPYGVTAVELGNLSTERTRLALAEVLERGILGSNNPNNNNSHRQGGSAPAPAQDDHDDHDDHDLESPSKQNKLKQDVLKLVASMRAQEEEGSPAATEYSPQAQEADKNADMAANVLTSVLLRSSPETGIDPREVEHRREVFGSNAIADKETDSFLFLCFEAVQDFVLIMLIVLGVISVAVEVTTIDADEDCKTCWIEGAAILCSVLIVVFVTAGIDYVKQFQYIRLTRSLYETNTKAVIRDGKQVAVTDHDIVVGDILSVNSHSLASIPADCIVLGPATDLKVDESTLTGESKFISKKPGDIVLSGTSAVQGSGKMVVIAVGINSVAGKIKARVYDSDDLEDGLDGDDDNSPLFVKLDSIAKRIGVAGTVAALIAFIGSCVIGLGIEGDSADHIIDYLVTAITVLAVAVPEGLPLAVTLALAFSSNKMMKESNLVKHLDACETMGCATTICTDKTGTLTANKMTTRALFAGKVNYLANDPSVSLGTFIKTHMGGASPELIDYVCRAIAVDTMNETVLYLDKNGAVEGAAGNPTEVALLSLVHDLGADYEMIRNTTKGRSDQGKLGEFLSTGKQFGFSSARKMMSWAVPREEGGYRLFCKGAQEVILARCEKYVAADNTLKDLTVEDEREMNEIALAYARRGMRCIGLAYRDLPEGFSLDAINALVKNSDGADAFEAETELTMIGLVGIEDPLRPEVPGAIEKCYHAGIDVRLVTGDNANTAVSIAYQAGIIRDFHFIDGTTERVAMNLKDNVLLEGKVFRSRVYRDGEDGKREFDQSTFDKIWPHLRVLARSSPDDKLTLAHGLNQSNLFADKVVCKKLEEEDGIKIFPDRQVVAMTGDGTNDAPALKRADVGFAMGVAGTQIAKDAADIILLDDNFASIVTAAKWGRNVYASIQKFLQFQLTVNIAAVASALVGAFAHQTSPLAAIQLLWVNLLMDSLASLALASEPPVASLLEKPPVNRTDSMITKRMWANMLGHAFYQITVVMVLLFAGPELLNVEPGHIVEDRGDNSIHYTVIFNSFVWMQLFNEVNCRKLKGEFNVFSGILDNRLFCGILLTTAVLQVLIVEFGSLAFRVAENGLDGKFWALSMIFGIGSLPVQQVINVFYRVGQHYKGIRMRKRIAKDGAMTTMRANGTHSHRD